MENRTENSRRYGGRWRKTQKIMKLCMLFLCAAFLQVSANTYSQEAKLDLKVNNNLFLSGKQRALLRCGHSARPT